MYFILICCILFYFYIKPQLLKPVQLVRRGCILFYFYIKPQPAVVVNLPQAVVSYSISTSNHNYGAPPMPSIGLYLILFLHQTTTLARETWQNQRCILFYFYIKPQHVGDDNQKQSRCILFYFYIKPQLSNFSHAQMPCCILFYFYIKPQLCDRAVLGNECCILFYFYIKPQRRLSYTVIPRKLHRFND